MLVDNVLDHPTTAYVIGAGALSGCKEARTWHHCGHQTSRATGQETALK
jgi:hypothetical protein